MNDTLELHTALAASQAHRALYEIDGQRAFVSARGNNFDVAIRSSIGQATRLNQSDEVLTQLLAKHNIPQDHGWRPQQKEASPVVAAPVALLSVRAINAACQAYATGGSGHPVHCSAIGYEGSVRVIRARSVKGTLIVTTVAGNLIFSPDNVFLL